MDVAEPNDQCQDRLVIDESPRATRGGGLPLIKHLVAEGRYLLTQKVLDLLSEGYFELEDLEHSIVNGVVEKTECDELRNSLGNKKYVIVGPDRRGYQFYCVGKIQCLGGSRLYLVITAHHVETNYD